MKAIDYPFHIAANARTALAGEEKHIRDLIEQVLFTAPGERVNRPTFGSGLRELVFAGQNDALAQATQSLVQSALQQWLGELIEVNAVVVESDDARLNVTVQYTVRRTQNSVIANFQREV